VPDSPLTPAPEAPIEPKEAVVYPEEAPVQPKEVSITELRGLPGAGVKLAHWILIIISVFVVLSVGWIGVSEYSYSHWLYSQHSSVQSDDVKAIITEHAAFREFWLKVFQMVLLNVLLPVLTAVLGYTFGSRSHGA
jgi:hypothetical protein